MQTAVISIRCSDTMLAQLRARAPEGKRRRGRVVRRDLDRLYKAYKIALRSAEVTRAEAAFLVPLIYDLDPFRLGESLEEIGLDYNEQVGIERLIYKLKKLSLLEGMAVVDALEKTWMAIHTNENRIPQDEQMLDYVKQHFN